MRVNTAVRPLTDVDLLRAVAEGGGEESCSELYDRVAPMVYGIAKGVLGHEALAQEVARDVLLEVMRTCAAFDVARGSVRSWVAAIAHRRAVEARRALRTEAPARPTAAAGVERTPRTLDGPDGRSALGRLSTWEREAIEMAYFGGATYREVAGALDVPLGTARSRLTGALHRLRTAVIDLP